MTHLPFRLAFARLRQQSANTITLIIITALALLSMMGLSAISRDTTNSLVNYSISQMPPGDREFTIVSAQTLASPTTYQAVNSYLAKNLAGLVEQPLQREVIHSPISDPHGNLFYFGAIDGVPGSVTLLSGRLPTPCTPAKCEVLEIANPRDTKIDPTTFGLTIVGHAAVKNQELFAGTMSASPGTPLILADGVLASDALPTFANWHGADAWLGSVNVALIKKIGISAYIDQVNAFNNQLSLDYPEISLVWPQDALSNAADQSQSNSQKFMLLEFIIASMLVAFLVLIWSQQREQRRRHQELLRRVGTPEKTIVVALGVEYLLPLFVGALIAIGLSAAITPIRSGVISPFGNTNLTYWLIPIAYVAIPFAILHYLLMSVSHLIFKRNRNGYLLFKERRRLWQSIASLLSITLILAILGITFASGVAAKINQETLDQVPLDFTIKTGAALVRPLDVASAAGFANIVPGSHAFSVLRTGTSVRSQSDVADSLSLIGIAPKGIALADPALSDFSRSLPNDSDANNGYVSIGSAHQLSVTTVNIPSEIDLLGWFLTPNGTHQSYIFSESGNTRNLNLIGQVPAGSRLVAFELQESSNFLSRRLHAIGESNHAVPFLSGNGSLSSVALDGHPATPELKGWGITNFDYSFDAGSIYLRPPMPKITPLVAVDPLTATLAQHSLLTLSGADNSYFQVKIARVISSFPTAGDRFVIMDLAQMQDELSAGGLGTIDPIELWVSTPHPSAFNAALQEPKYSGLVIEGRSAIAREYRNNPSELGITRGYHLATLFALVAFIIFYIFTLLGIARANATLLNELEIDGVPPGRIRVLLLNSLRFTVVAGIVVGSALGVLVGRFFVSASLPIVEIVTGVLLLIIANEICGRTLLIRKSASKVMQ